MLLLSQQDVSLLLPMNAAMQVAEESFAAFSRGESITPQRLVIPVEPAGGLSFFMPSYLRESALAVKVVSLFKHNPSRYDLPSISGVVLLLDDRSGLPLALMEGGYLTAVRTGAASGVATKYLARENSRVVGCLGSGAQALTQIWAVSQAREIARVKIYSPHIQARIDEVRRELEGWVAAEIVPVASAEEAVRESDVVVLATTATDPIVEGSWFEPGAHINAVGSHSPGARELDSSTLARSTVVCDSLAACLVEAGDLLIPIAGGQWRAEECHADLGEIILGRKPGRSGEEEITVFKSVGLAFQDAAIARYLYEQALARQVGQRFEFGPTGASLA